MSAAHSPRLGPWCLLLAVAIALYLLGLNSHYAPTNGDEMVYIHIARLTAASGHWLPLVSDLDHMRNTKPPLLFWQAMASGDWSAQGGLAALRWPSVAYTLLTTAGLGAIALRISGLARTALLAALLFLAFFSTFRYGRVYLTSAPETFWLALPMGWLLWLQSRPAAAQAAAGGPMAPLAPSIGFYAVAGLAMGLGLLYKSFALIAPAAATLWCALVLQAGRPLPATWLRISAGTALSALLALGLFSLWFVLDPDPQAVWQEFVVGENGGKLGSGMGYWQAAWSGEHPLWLQLLAYPENAGLLFPVALGLCIAGVRAAWRGETALWRSGAQGTLLVWVLLWLVVFCIPSQRSARYLLPAMPAFALLLALHWERLARAWFVATLVLSAVAAVLLTRFAWVIAEVVTGAPWAPHCALLACAAACTALLAGLWRSAWSRAAALVASLSVYACFIAMAAPLDSPQADFSAELRTQMQGRTVAVPNGFNAQYERFAFVFPGSLLVPYDVQGRQTGALHPELADAQRLPYLLTQADAVVWQEADVARAAPPCAPACQVLGSRWYVKSRHRTGEVTLANLWQPQQWLLGREWLVAARP